MEKQSRREAVRAYKERPSVPGVFSVVCRPTGETWVAASPAVDVSRNGLWFGLRVGNHQNKPLQAAWREHGEGAFDHAVLERNTDEELSRLGRDLWLKERTAHWLEALGARPLFG